LKEKIVKKIDYLLDLADRFEESAEPSTSDMGFGTIATTKYNVELYSELKNSTKSLVLKLYEKEHPYYSDLNKSLTNLGGTKNAKGILKAIKLEIQDGFIISIRDLLSAEIFTDFIEMAEYLIQEKYKDAAAVIVGSVLENRIRILMSENDMEIFDQKGNPKKASLINDELYKADIYGKLDQKSIVAWLDLRNQAAHGHYEQYNLQQVELMLSYVRDFLNRVKL
jgi:hypothetical protein